MQGDWERRVNVVSMGFGEYDNENDYEEELCRFESWLEAVLSRSSFTKSARGVYKVPILCNSGNCDAVDASALFDFCFLVSIFNAN